MPCSSVLPDKAAAIDGLVAPMLTSYPYPAIADDAPDPATCHILDLGHVSRVYKTLLSGGHYDTKTNTVEIVDPAFKLAFAQAFWKTITSEDAGGKSNAAHIAEGNAPFCLVELISTLKEDSSLFNEVKEVLCAPEPLALLEKGWRKGAQTLYTTLKELA